MVLNIVHCATTIIRHASAMQSSSRCVSAKDLCWYVCTMSIRSIGYRKVVLLVRIYPVGRVCIRCAVRIAIDKPHIRIYIVYLWTYI